MHRLELDALDVALVVSALELALDETREVLRSMPPGHRSRKVASEAATRLRSLLMRLPSDPAVRLSS